MIMVVSAISWILLVVMSELIDTFDSKSFTAEILTLKTAPVIRNNVVYYEKETGYPDDIPMYVPMK